MDGGGNVGTSTPAALLVERLTRLAESIEGFEPGERAGPSDNGESLRALIDTFPRLANAAAALVDNLARGLGSLEPAEAAELVSAAFGRLDGARLGEALNSLSRVTIRLHESDPELLARAEMKVTAGAIETLDFGALRKRLSYRSKAHTDYRIRLIEEMGGQPVGLINVVGVLPDYVNNTVALLGALLEMFAFPPEMITYVVLELLDEVEWTELTRTLNGLFRFVNSIERGDLIIGDRSSRLADVMEDLSEDVIRELDLEAAAGTVSALADYLQMAGTSFLTAAFRKEDGARAVGSALTAVANLLVRSVSGVLEAAAELPPEVLTRLTADFREDFAARELGTAADSAVALFNRFTAGGEGELPESAASVANSALASFNRLSDDDLASAAQLLDRFLQGLDAGQVEEAARKASSRLADAALRRPGLVTALGRALLSGALAFVKGYLKNLWTGRRKGVRA